LQKLAKQELQLYSDKTKIFWELNRFALDVIVTMEKLLLDDRSECKKMKETLEVIIHEINRAFYKFLLVLKNLYNKESLIEEIFASNFNIFNNLGKDPELEKMWIKLTNGKPETCSLILKFKDALFYLFRCYEGNIELNSRIFNTKSLDPMKLTEKCVVAVWGRTDSKLLPIFQPIY
jgi:hypothetical protein